MLWDTGQNTPPRRKDRRWLCRGMNAPKEDFNYSRLERHSRWRKQEMKVRLHKKLSHIGEEQVTGAEAGDVTLRT